MHACFKVIATFAALAGAAGCGGPVSAPADASPPPPMSRSFGELMSEVGRRFELAGRATVNNRFEYGAYQIRELSEMFDQDLVRAEAPKEGHPEVIPAFLKAFAATQPAALRKAVISKDRAAFAIAYAEAAETCNACHTASGHGFIEIPKVPGRPVPMIEATGPSADAGAF